MLEVAQATPLTEDEAGRFAIDGRTPSLRAAPATPGEVAAVLHDAAASGLAVAPWGAGTSMGYGAPPERIDIVLEMGRLSGLVEYKPADLTAVALAGTPLAVLQETFAREEQWLALDPPYAERATLGGVLAVNDSGPHRLRYGTARNLVLGMQVAHCDGRLTRSGARVVKSVAGYNVHKLHIGALGTLGVIVEVALRLHPLPSERAAVLCAVDGPDVAGAIAARLARMPLKLGALELLNAQARESLLRRVGLSGDAAVAPYTLVALCEGYSQMVRRQIREVTDAAAAHSSTVGEIVYGEAAAGIAAALAAAPENDGGQLAMVMSVPPSQTGVAMADLEGAIARYAPGARVMAHAGSGIVRAIVPLDDVPHEDGSMATLVTALVERARALAHGRGGHLVVRDCPSEAKHALDIWGPVATPELMRRLKVALDPTRTLNPGRFVEGL